MKCPHCGAEVPEGDLFCGECGQQIRGEEPPTLYAPAVSPGPPASVAPEIAPEVTREAPKAKRAFPWLIIVLVLVGLCVICGGGGTAVYMLIPTATQTPVPTATQTPVSPTPTPTVPAPTPTAAPTATPTPLAPTQTPTPAVETSTYSDPYAGYSIAYPVGWVIVDETLGESTLLAETAAVDDDPAAGDFCFCIVEPDITDLDDLRQEFESLFVGEDIKLAGSEPATVGGTDGVALTLKGTSPDASAEMQILALLTVRGDIGYAFLFGAPSADWADSLPTFEVMIASLSLSDPVEMSATPTPAPQGERKVTSLVFASAVDEDDAPLGVTSVFPPGVSEVFAVFEYEGFEGLTEYEAVYSLNGEEDVSGTLELDGDDSGTTWVRRYNDEGLASGTYAIEIYVEGRRIARSEFTVLGGEMVLEDDFADVTSGWSTKETDISRTWYEDQTLHVQIKEGGWTTYSVYESDGDNSFGDLYLSVNAWLVEVPDEGGQYGVVARRDDQSYYQFLIRENGTYNVRKHTDEGWTSLTEWAESDAINQGVDNPNRFGIVCNGPELLFFVNGIYLTQVEDASFTSGQIGLMAGSYEDGPNVHAVFDDLVVYGLE